VSRRGPRPGTTRATASSAAAGALDSTTARPSGPVRTCVGCRERAARADLLRVVVAGDRLVPDPARRLPGRGASVHLDLRCLDLAEKRRAFPRALRLPGPLDATDVRQAVREALAGPPGSAAQGAEGPPVPRR
jgi:uncharacterized protein